MSNDLVEMNWSEVIDTAEEKFVEIMPSNMNFISERSFAVQILKGNDYLMKVAKNNKNSLLASMMNVAAIGLSLNPAKKQAYLIPRKGIICMDPSYMGLCDLATMSGSIKWVQARPVYKNDDYLDNGIDKEPSHKFNPFATTEERGEFVGVYCIAKTSDGDYLTTTMTATEVNDIMGRSESVKARGQSPWKTDFIEQAKKTVVRRAYKLWPKTESMDRMALAVELSNLNEGFQKIESSPDLGQFTDDQKIYFDQLIEQSNDIGMFLFINSLEEAVYISLYNSFKKGGDIGKGAYQRIVVDLQTAGREKMFECIAQIDACAEAQEESGILELVEDASQEFMAYVADNACEEAVQIIKEMVEDHQ